MSAKQRTKNRIRQRLVNKLENLSVQEDALYFVIKTYVDKARGRAEEVLGIGDTDGFLQQYGELEQRLDRTFSVCELLTATAEDMIENQTPDGQDPLSDTEVDFSLVASGMGKHTTGSLSRESVPRAITPENKPPDDVLKRELQGIIEKGLDDMKKSKAREEGASSGDKQAGRSSRANSEQQSNTDHQDLSSVKQQATETPAVSSPANVKVEPEQHVEALKPAASVDTDSKRLDSRSINRTVPRCVKKSLKSYDSGYNEVSSQISEVSEQEETFVKGLNKSSPDRMSSPQKKQKSPLKKKKGKKETTPPDTPKTGQPGQAKVLDSQKGEKAKAVKVDTQKEDECEPVKVDSQKNVKSRHSEIKDQGTENKPAVTQDKTSDLKETKECKQVAAKEAEECKKRLAKDMVSKNSSQTQAVKDLSDTRSGTWKDLDREGLSSLCAGMQVAPLLQQEVTPVVVSEITSPWCFFVQPNCPQLKHLMAEICGYMSRVGLLEPHIEAPKVGMVCLARFSTDKAFYRAYMTKVYSTADGAASHVDVLYLDYGNKEKVKVTELRLLPESFKILPPQAACCALAEVMPGNRYCVWTEEDIFSFKQFVCNQQLSCIRACSSSVYDIPHLVKLIGNYPTPSGLAQQYVMQQLSIGQFLINRGTAKFIDLTEQTCHLIKTEEGKEEATILNGALSAVRAGPRIRELNDSVVMATTLGDSVVAATTLGDSAVTAKSQHGDSVNVGVCKATAKHGDVSAGDKTNINTGDMGETAKHDGNVKQRSTEKSMKEKGDSESSQENKDVESIVKTRDTKHMADSNVVAGKGDAGSVLETSVNKGNNRTPKSQAEEKQAAVMTNMAGQRTNDSQKSGNASSTCTDSLDTTRTGSETPDIDQTTKPVYQHQVDKDQSSKTSFNAGLGSMLALKSDISSTPQGREVMLAHVKSPGHFYVHLVSEEVSRALDTLMADLNAELEKYNRRKLAALSRTFTPAMGKMCCAQFTQDNNFYRAVIKSMKLHQDEETVDKILLQYVDFGDEEWVSRHRVFPLPPDLDATPLLATRCSLAFIKPAGVKEEGDRGEGSDGKWPEGSTEIFTSLAGFEKTLHMHIVQGSLTGDKSSTVDEEEGSLGVLLVDNTGTEEVCINFELIRTGQAKLDASLARDRNVGGEKSEAIDVWNPMEDDYMSKRNSYRIDVDDAGVATTGYKAQDETQICKFFSQGRRCWRGDLCPYKHVQTDSGVSLDKEPVYALSGHQDRLLPAVHSWVALEVTTILTPGRFYAVLPLGKKSLDVTTSESEDPDDVLGGANCNETLDDLLTALNAEYNKRPSFQGTSILKATGEIVAARFSQDQQWYRARVVQITEDKVKVFYVDFGNTEWLPEDETAEIKPEFLHLPFQALECFLYRMEPPDETWSKEAQDYFKELVDGKTLVGHIRSSSWNSCLTVELFDTTTDQDVNIGDALVERGCAVRAPLPVESSCNVSEPSSSRRSSVSTGSVQLVPG